MENENKRENENINEEINEVNEELIEETEDISEEDVVEEISDVDIEAENEEAANEASDDELVEEGEVAEADAPIATIDEAEALAAISKPRSKKPLIITAVVALAAIAVIAIYCVLTIFGVGSKTIVANPLTNEAGEVVIENIRYENPLVSLFEKEVALNVNGLNVSRRVMQYATNSMALTDVTSLVQDGEKFDFENFDWNAKRKDSKLSLIEYSKGLAVGELVPIYAMISEGNKRDIGITEQDEKELAEWIDGLKKQYGDKFEETLKANGYDDIQMLEEFQKMNLNVQKVYEDISTNLDKYASAEKLKPYMDESMITAKHILIMIADDTEEAKLAAKQKADEIYAKIKDGADFDEMVAQYNEDQGATEDGYTFANDGSMVQEFADTAFALEIGEVSEPVEVNSHYKGYHIIKRVDRKPAADDYVDMLVKTSKVKLYKNVYDKMGVTININDYLGEK